MAELPLPPLQMREAVGPTDPALFDNPEGHPIFPAIPEEAYESVFDFGCGCGRLARQLIQQRPRPRDYLGIDLNRPLVEWCSQNLSPQAPGFEFGHHDVHYDGKWNRGEGKPQVLPFPTGDGTRTLVIAYSVFTHLIQAHAEYYLDEVRRVLAPGGVFLSTWFLFDKRLFPMMQDFQNALYINEVNPANAVIFDRNWLLEAASGRGLKISAAEPPAVRGFQWHITMTNSEAAEGIEELPGDEAPISEDGMRAAADEPEFESRVAG